MKEKTLEKILKENQIKMRNKRQEQLKRLKKEERKNNVLALLIGSFMLLTTILLITNMDNKFVNDCVNSGYSENYCRSEI